MNELRRLMTEYKEANTQFYDCLKMGDTRWELYQKQMKVIWAKIKIELDDICPLTMDDIQTIAEYAREQDSQYIGDCVNLYAKFKRGCRMMLKGLDTKEIGVLLCEYKELCYAFDVDKKGWITFKDYLILRTGIGLEKEMKLYKVKQRIDDIEEDFKDE